MKPTGLAATLTPGDGATATLSWTENGTATDWVLEYGTASDFTGATPMTTGFTVSGTTVTANLTGLTAEQTYYARVKADCGGGDTSEWSNTVSFTPTDAYSITLNDGTNTNDYVPFYGYYCDYGAHSQFIIPATDLDGLQWASFDKLTFFSSKSSASWGDARFDIYMMETTNTVFDNTTLLDWTTMTKVGSNVSVSISDNKMEITLTSPFTYQGGNLLIGFNEITNGSDTEATWYGKTGTTNTGIYNYSSYKGFVKFLPKMTIEYTPGEEPDCLPVSGLSFANVDHESAKLSWTASESNETAWKLQYRKDGTTEWTTVSVLAENLVNGAYPLTNLQSNTTYNWQVAAWCDTDNDEAISTYTAGSNFTTDCEAITIDGENSYDVDLKASTIADCWSQTAGTYQWSFDTYNGATFNATSSYTQTSTKLLSPLFTLGEGDYWFSFKGKLYGGSEYDYGEDEYVDKTATLIVYYRTSSTGEWVPLGSQPYTATGYYPETLDESEIVLPAGTCQLAFEAITRYYDYYDDYAYAYLYDMTIEKAPSCIKPKDFEAISDGYTALLTWNSQVGAYEIAHATDATANPDENNEGTATDEEFEMDNLALGDHYFWVRANCGETDGNSDWAGPVSVHIGYCVPAPTKVDGSGISNVTFGMGDNIVNNNTSMSTSIATYLDCTSETGAVQAGVASTIAITYKTGYTYGTIIWVDFNNNLSFEESEIIYTGTSTSSNPTTLNASITIPVTQATGDYRMRIGGADSAFDGYISGSSTATAPNPCYTGEYACFQDYTLRVLEAPSCMPAGNVTVALEDITTTSAVIRWTNTNGDEATYTVKQGENVLTTTAVDSYTLDNLTASTTYPAGTYTIIANCDETAVASVPEFATQCDVITVDAANVYFEDFSSWMPLCWELGDEVSAGYSGTNNWKKDSNSAYSGYYGTIDLYMPTLNINASNAVLTFKSKESDISYYTDGDDDSDGLNIVKISTDNGSTWTQLWCPTIDELTTSFRTVTISLQNYVNQDILIAFEYQGNYAHGWYIDDVLVAVPFTKTIAAYNGNGGYYLVASPLADNVNPTTVGMITDNLGAEATTATSTYDLYSFDQAKDLEWRNYRASAFNLVNGHGYLYASKEGTTLTFTGVPYSGNGKVTLSKTDDTSVDFQGWNLVGNPFGVRAYLTGDYYVMNEGGTDVEAAGRNYVEPMEGIFAVANEDGETLTFTTDPTNNGNKGLALNLSHGRNVIDRAIVRFGEGRQLPKFQLNPNHTKVYIPVDGQDYAVVRGEEMGEMPVSFKAENNGTYNLSFNAEEVSFAYLHLIDNMTGADVDLLETPSYTFNATTTDYESRFKLVFATGSSTGSDTFAFYSNGNWVINNPSTGSGLATLQVIDVTGRILKSESINGCANVNFNAAPGVYMLRLVNGDNVKVQKVVVR